MTAMNYVSLCDGIGAVCVAWQPLGWRCQWTSEIEPFPIAVVEHHWKLPNLGDMTKIDGMKAVEQYGRPDLVCGGTPCQSFSVAGLRKGMADPRGNLALVFLRLVDTLRPRWVVWENVPGLFAHRYRIGLIAFLRELSEIGYGFCWRVLNARYFGLAQNRERVFFVGNLGDWRAAAKVLLEPESVHRDIATSRQTGEDVAGTLENRARGGGFPGTDEACSGYVQAVSRTLTACKTATGRLDPNEQEFVVTGPLCSHSSRHGHAMTTQQAAESNQMVAETLTASWHRSNGAKAGNNVGMVNPIIQEHRVRRLLPVECERLMGFPDDYTLIQFRGKPSADGPRYRALGNSMAVPCMVWIGRRIEMVTALTAKEGPC